MKRKILLIDDEKDFCYFIKKGLEATGDFEVSVCCDSTGAIGQAKEVQPDLILLDIMMPEVSGSDIAAELKGNWDTQRIPIVFLTALVTKRETEERKGVIGGDYFVAKPVKMNELTGIMNRFFTR